MTAKRQWRKQRRGHKYNKDDNSVVVFTNDVCKVRDSCIVSSARWLVSVADVGRVVEVQLVVRGE